MRGVEVWEFNSEVERYGKPEAVRRARWRAAGYDVDGGAEVTPEQFDSFLEIAWEDELRRWRRGEVPG